MNIRLDSAISKYHEVMDYTGIITIEPGKRSGKPCIPGLRMTVSDVLEYLASGMTHEQILSDFPLLMEEDIPRVSRSRRNVSADSNCCRRKLLFEENVPASHKS